MKLILNIGLAREGKPDIGPCVALNVLRANGFIVEASKLDVSDTERTLVAVVDHQPVGATKASSELYFAAHRLGQDCVAVLGDDGGALIGPRADKWGAFNPAFFIMPDGRRLSYHLAQREEVVA